MRTPEMVFQSVGVAGFEPTASSSRIQIGFAGLQRWTAFLLVVESPCDGCTRLRVD
jgi:hypothetical protein